MWHCDIGYVVSDVSRQCSGLMFKGVKVCKDLRLLKMRTLHCLEMSQTKYPLTQCHFPEN